MKVEFLALMKKLEIKSLVSMDKEARLTLQFNAENNELINKINQLMKADELVKVRLENATN